jgi:hypothetical protein
MATPTGTISFNDLRTETGLTGAISLGDGKVQDLIGRTSNIDMATARGKTSFFQFEIASNTSRSFITTMAYDAGWQGTGDLFAVIGFGTVISTLVTGTNSWGDITLLNIGTIVGSGGNGAPGAGGYVDSAAFAATIFPGGPGNSGGHGLVVSTPSTNRVQRVIRLNNLGDIYGGGGGGGGGDAQAAGTGPGNVDIVGGGGGGGGAGRLPGAGGAGGVVSVINGGGIAVNGSAGGLANQNEGGYAGAPGDPPRYGQWIGGYGGTGGNLGAGGEGGNPNAAGWGYQGAGGAAGYAIIGYGNLTIDRLGFTVGTLG